MTKIIGPRSVRSLGIACVLSIASACGGSGGGPAAPPKPTSLSYDDPQTYTVGVQIAALGPTLQGSVSEYSVAPALPIGLSLDVSDGEISGTPAQQMVAGAYVVTASNAGGATTFSLSITVNDAPPSALSYPAIGAFVVGTPVGPMSPSVTGLHVSYSIAPRLPDGLSFDGASGAIGGTATVASTSNIYVITAQNTGGSTTYALTIVVLPAAPTALSYGPARGLTIGSLVTPIDPTVNGSVDSYTVTPALPAGLVLDPASGRISGTPMLVSPATNYTIVAANPAGAVSSVLTLSVVPIVPSALSYPSPLRLALGFAMTPASPTINGTAPTYSVSPALPAGLSLAGDTGVISGTPTTAQAAGTYTVTAANGAGSTTTLISLTVATVTLTPTKIVRTVIGGTSVDVSGTITLVNFMFAGALTAMLSDPSGTFVGPVSVTAGSGISTITLSTWSRQPPGHYAGTLTLLLCSDTACTVPQAVPSVAIPYDVEVLSTTSAWPGDNLSALVAWPSIPDWNQFQGNAAHTGYVDVQIDPNQIRTRWQTPAIDIPAVASENLNLLAASDGQFYISGGSKLYARSEFDGSTVWTYDFSALGTQPSINPPSVADGVVYAAAGEQSSTYLFAFAATDGSVVFKAQMTSQSEHYFAPAIGSSGVYTNGGTYGGLYGFDFTGHRLFFKNSLPQVSAWTPAVDSQGVYAYTDDALHVFDPVTGNTLATIASPTSPNYDYEINGASVLGGTGMVFAADYSEPGSGNVLIAFDVPSSSVKWQVSGAYAAAPAYHAGVLYLGNNTPLQLEARSETDGSLLWSWVPPQGTDTSFASEVLLTQSLIFVSTNQATYALDAISHRVVWSFPQSGKLALSSSGILYIEGRQTSNPYAATPTPGFLSAFTVK